MADGTQQPQSRRWKQGGVTDDRQVKTLLSQGLLVQIERLRAPGNVSIRTGEVPEHLSARREGHVRLARQLARNLDVVVQLRRGFILLRHSDSCSVTLSPMPGPSFERIHSHRQKLESTS